MVQVRNGRKFTHLDLPPPLDLRDPALMSKIYDDEWDETVKPSLT